MRVLPSLRERDAEQDKRTLRQVGHAGLPELLGALQISLLRELGDVPDLSDPRAALVQGGYRALSDLLDRINAAMT
jgi:hypothetical protein